jgi:fructokinase
LATSNVIDKRAELGADNLFMNNQKKRDNAYRLGIDLGGTKTEVVVLDGHNSPVFRKRVDTPIDDYNAILSLLINLVAEAEQVVGQRLAVGIGTPGAISPRTGLLRNSNTTCMNGRAFKDDFEKRLQRHVHIQNDANYFALSESINGPHAITGEWGHNPLLWHTERDGSPRCWPVSKRFCRGRG